ncbi:hypothetical protein, partial [Pseudonocardia acaciae]|uniref:hypothetical protein n=1 Tax=Pseudonocardia acaciae TaxID=551276 RepID=UPI001B808138
MTDRPFARAMLVRCAPERPERWHDMADGLRDRFGAEVSIVRPGQLTSPATMLAAISKNLARPGDPLLLVVSGAVTRFVRRAGDIWALVLPDSVPGRPRSMLRLDDLVETAARASAGRPLLFGLDARTEDIEISATDLADRLAVACHPYFPWSSGILVRASSVERRASSVERRA